ncbi:hypothetical protein WJX81_000837 [Elliptochloris bilobata]|uniref:MIF4G domain-containing protein n=1 Tax=Elliptochloris bilobata TaxID=381761 RepID=A0AAW1SIP7_9CHLO
MGDQNRRRRAYDQPGGGYTEHGHRGGGRGGGGGFKRRRDDGGGQEDGIKPLLASIIRLCDQLPGQPPPAIEEDLDVLQRTLARDLVTKGAALRRIILDCAVELSPKTPVYATLIGLLNTDNPQFVAELVALAQAEFNEAVAAPDRHKARMLLRLFAALVVANVLHPSSVVAALQQVVDAAIAVAEAGGTADSGRGWQPYADHLAYAALAALPWGGSELADSAPAEVGRLFESAERYMGMRPRAVQPALRPFFDARGDADAAAASDSGGASFLGQVWDAVSELRTTGNWVVTSIPRLFYAFEAALAAGQPHDLPPLTIPLTLPGAPLGTSPTEAAAALAAAFPARGLIRLLPAEHTEQGKPRIERLVAEEYILDTLHYFDGDRVQCARRLAMGLPLPDKHESLLAEMLFSQMLRLPAPAFKPLAYSALMVDVCKLVPTFPRSMSACVRECFARLGVMDPELRVRLSEWLAYHLSNFEFMWPWDKWRAVLDAPPHDSQRRFTVATLSRLVRLSYWARIESVLPPTLHGLLPPKPEVQSLDAPAPHAENGLANGENGDAPMPEAAAEPDAETRRAREVLDLVRRKEPAPALLTWAKQPALAGELGGAAGIVACVLRALLVAGAKSFTHMLIMLERYHAALEALLVAAGPQGEEAAVATAARVWEAAPQRAAQAIDRLLALRLVRASAVVRWAFSTPAVLALRDELGAGLAWEAFHGAVAKTLARTQDAREELAAAQAAMADAHVAAAAPYEPAEGAAAPPAEEIEAAAAAAAAVTRAAEDEVTTKEAELSETLEEERELLLLAFTLFRDTLAAGHAELQAAASATAAAADAAAKAAADAAIAAVGSAAAAEPAAGVDEGPTAEGDRGGAAAAAAREAERRAWFAFTLASLRECARRYGAAAAPLVARLEAEVFAEGAAPAEVRATVHEGLHY